MNRIKIVSNRKEGTKIYQDDTEIKLVVGYELSQNDKDRMPILKLELLAPEVELEIEECEIKEQ